MCVACMWQSQQKNDALAIRKKQVAALQAYFQGSLQTLQPDVLFEIPVAAPGRQLVRVSVALPEQFPYQPPVLQVVPPVASPHLDASGYVRASAHEGLSRWNVQNNLGKVVYEVVAGVIAPAAPPASNNKSSPSLYPVGVQSPPPPPPPDYGTAVEASKSRGSASAAAAADKIVAVDVPTSFPEVDSKSVDELQVCECFSGCTWSNDLFTARCERRGGAVAVFGGRGILQGFVSAA